MKYTSPEISSDEEPDLYSAGWKPQKRARHEPAPPSSAFRGVSRHRYIVVACLHLMAIFEPSIDRSLGRLKCKFLQAPDVFTQIALTRPESLPCIWKYAI